MPPCLSLSGPLYTYRNHQYIYYIIDILYMIGTYIYRLAWISRQRTGVHSHGPFSSHYEQNKLCDHFYFKQARFCASLYYAHKKRLISLLDQYNNISRYSYIYIIFSLRKGQASMTWSNSPPGPVDAGFWWQNLEAVKEVLCGSLKWLLVFPCPDFIYLSIPPIRIL